MKKQITHIINAESTIGHEWWLNYLNEINFYNINELRELSLDFQPGFVESIELKTVLLTGIGKRALLMGQNTKAIESFREAKKIIEANEDEIHKDIIAFFYFEYEMLFSHYDDLENSKVCIQKMKQFASSEQMVALVEYKCALYNYDATHINRLIEKVNRFKELKKYSSYVMGFFRIAVAYEKQRDFSKTEHYQKIAMDNSIKYNIPTMVEIIHNAIGFRYILMDQYDKGIDYLLKHIENVESYYTRVLMTENMAYASYLKKDYQTSADKFLEAYNLAKINHVVSQLPEECMFLGFCYDHLDKPQEALAYFKLAHDHAKDQIADGFSYSGPRLEAMDAYLNYLEKLTYRKFKENPSEDIFQYALGRPWREIMNIFQYHFMMVHLRKTNVKEDLFKPLDMNQHTFFSVKKKLKKAGFSLPNIKDTPKEFDPKFKIDGLRLYIENNLINLTWKDAHKRFEKDAFRFLFQQYGFQKRKMESVLQLSYPSIWKKLKEIGSDQQYGGNPM